MWHVCKPLRESLEAGIDQPELLTGFRSETVEMALDTRLATEDPK